MNALITHQNLENLDQLALITEIRKLMSQTLNTIDIKGLLEQTDLLKILDQILSLAENH